MTSRAHYAVFLGLLGGACSDDTGTETTGSSSSSASSGQTSTATSSAASTTSGASAGSSSAATSSNVSSSSAGAGGAGGANEGGAGGSGGEGGAGGGAPIATVTNLFGSHGGHTCAVLDTGAVRCWGRGHLGQLGYGNLNDIGDDETPAGFTVAVGGDVLDLALGNVHSCARLTNGGVRCWGSAVVGQLGYGNTMNVGDDELAGAGGDVQLGGNATALWSGFHHTCAKLTGGSIKCWGHGEFGVLGYGGGIMNIGDDETPASVGTVDVGGNVAEIAAGLWHNCARFDTGAVRCWGRNHIGQSGFGYIDTVGDDEAPSTVTEVDVGGLVTQLVAGAAHTCALLATGAVRCWGDSEYGALGYGNLSHIGDNETPASAGDVNVGGSAVALAAGDSHTCALLATGAVRCWGYGFWGGLGYAAMNDIGDDETPASAGDIDLGGLAVAIAAGTHHTCALLGTGRVRCWGRNSIGQLGYGHTNDIGDDETPASAGDVPL